VKTVGLRELKNRLSEHVRRVRAGHSLVVTDRGQVVAELLPPRSVVADRSGCRGLAELARRGSLSLGAGNDPRLYPRLPKRLPRGKIRRLLDEERGDH
jgi:prevent-host-death family protein